MKGDGWLTPDELIALIGRKIPELDLSSADEFEKKDDASEDYQNKIRLEDKKYNDDNRVRVLGNEEHDITVVNDDRAIDAHQVLTYERDPNGNLITDSHTQNVSQVDTISVADNCHEDVIEGATPVDPATEEEIVDSESSVTDGTSEETVSSDSEVEDNMEEEVVATLIPLSEFYRTLNENLEMTDDLRKSMDLYYAFFGDLILYEEFLLPDLLTILNDFRNYVLQIQVNFDVINENQQEACNKLSELSEKKNVEINKDKAVAEVKKLELKLPENQQSGFSSLSYILSMVLFVSIILTLVALLVIK